MATITVFPGEVRGCLSLAPLRLVLDVDNEKFWNLRGDNGQVALGGVHGFIFRVCGWFPEVPYKPTKGSPYLVEAKIADDSLRTLALAIQYLDESGVDLTVAKR